MAGEMPGKILVVDDDPLLRSFAVSILQESGLVTLEAGSGTAALDVLANESVSAVLLDQMMPGMSGLELAGHIRALPDHRLTPLLFVSADDDPQTRISALRAGASDFMVKPVLLEELAARVLTHLNISGQWRSIVTNLEKRATVVAAIASVSPREDSRIGGRVICERISEAHDGRGVAIYSCTDDHAGLDALASTGYLIPLEGDLATIVTARGQSGPWPHHLNPAEPAASGSAWLACAPLRQGTTLIGVLAIESSDSPDDQLLTAAMDYALPVAQYLRATMGQAGETSNQRQAVEAVLRSGGFRPVFQPIVDLRDDNVVGYEALTRLSDGQPVMALLAAAERAGVRGRCELALLTAALDQTRVLAEETWISINLSPSVLVEHNKPLAEIVASSTNRVVIELTENERIDDYPAVRQALAHLGEQVKLSVDDTGSGYASLRHVIDLRPDYLKLDRSWITDLGEDDIRQALIAGMVSFCQHSGTQLIAEGIETRPERATLQDLGVGLGQGYLLGMPAPLPSSASGHP